MNVFKVSLKTLEVTLEAQISVRQHVLLQPDSSGGFLGGRKGLELAQILTYVEGVHTREVGCLKETLA